MCRTFGRLYPISCVLCKKNNNPLRMVYIEKGTYKTDKIIIEENLVFDTELQKMFKEAFEQNYDFFEYIPNEFKTQEMCNQIISANPLYWAIIPDHFKTREMISTISEKLNKYKRT